MSPRFFLVLLSLWLLSSDLVNVMAMLHRPIGQGIQPSAVHAVTSRRISKLDSRRALLEDISALIHGRDEEPNSKSSGLGFSVIHRQHPSSPYREAHTSHAEVMQQHVRRGLLRLESLQKFTAAERLLSSNSLLLSRREQQRSNAALETKVLAPAGEWQGEYMVQMQLGTPSRVILLIIDTGSGLTWVQCSQCTQCFLQQEPIFDPMESKSYDRVGCAHPACQSNSLFQCSETSNSTCEYGVQYGMTSFSTGIVSTDTLTVDSVSGETFRLSKFLFGCGIFNVGQMVGNSGLLGLSRSNISFPMQLASSDLNFTRKFTHCFADLAANRNATSFMYLGDSRAHQLRYTSFANPPFRTQFYYVNLQGISVEDELLPIPSSAFQFAPDGSGGTVIDSGTTLTLLVQPAYVLLRDAFRAAADSKHRLNATAIPGGFNSTVTSHLVDTCFQLGDSYSPRSFSDSDERESKPNNSASSRQKRRLRVPRITLHLADGMDLSLPENNILFPFDDQGLYCLAFASTESEAGINVIGNIQQQNFRIEYDLENSRIGFGRAYCATEQ